MNAGTQFNALLLVALIASAMMLVRTSYESRRTFTALDRAKAEQQLLETDRQRLEADRQAQATPLRIERVARDKLGMRAADATVTLYLTDTGGPP